MNPPERDADDGPAGMQSEGSQAWREAGSGTRDGDDERFRELTLLRQKALALEAEIAERKLIEDEVAGRARMAALAVDVGRALVEPLTLPQALHRCAEAIVRHLDAAFARIWTIDQQGETLELQASAGLYTHLDGPESRVPVGELKIGRIAEERRPHLTNQVLDDPAVSDREWVRREGIVAFAGYPMVVEDRLVGVIALFARHPLSPDALDALATINDTVAVGIERKRAEEALREESAALETINHLGRLLTSELDLETLVQAITDAATQVTGAQVGAFFYNVVHAGGESYALYTLAGASREEFARFPMPRNTAIFGPTFRGEAVVRIDDVREDPRYGQNPPYYGTPPGHLPVVSYLAVPVWSRSGQVLGGLFFGHSQPAVFDERAERIVVGLAAQAGVAMDNARLYREAQEAIRMRDDFLIAASHDLRTPLTVIGGQAQVVRRRLRRMQDADERVVEGLESIERRTRMMAIVLDELVDATRLQAGQEIELSRERVDLAALARESVADMRQSTDRHTITVAITDAEMVGWWDHVRLSRVLGNLLSNAIKYSPEGGEIVVTLTREEGENGDWAVLAVRDRGLGVPPDDLPHIFDRFYRATNVMEKTAGTGIGLATARYIVQRHGGTISATTGEDEGATFVVRLPLSPSDTSR